MSACAVGMYAVLYTSAVEVATIRLYSNVGLRPTVQRLLAMNSLSLCSYNFELGSTWTRIPASISPIWDFPKGSCKRNRHKHTLTYSLWPLGWDVPWEKQRSLKHASTFSFCYLARSHFAVCASVFLRD